MAAIKKYFHYQLICMSFLSLNNFENCEKCSPYIYLWHSEISKMQVGKGDVLGEVSGGHVWGAGGGRGVLFVWCFLQ